MSLSETGRGRMGTGGLNHWTPAETKILRQALSALQDALPDRSLKAIVRRVGVVGDDMVMEAGERG